MATVEIIAIPLARTIGLCDVFSAYGASTKPSLAELAANFTAKIGGVARLLQGLVPAR